MRIESTQAMAAVENNTWPNRVPIPGARMREHHKNTHRRKMDVDTVDEDEKRVETTTARAT